MATMANESVRPQGRQARAFFSVFGVIAIVTYFDLTRDNVVFTRNARSELSPSIRRHQELSSAIISSKRNSTAESASLHLSASGSPNKVPNEQAAEQARHFVLGRRDEYHKQGLDYRWKLRGNGYLYTVHHLILLAQLPSNNNNNIDGSPIVGTTQKVTIHNVSNKTVTDCDKYTIWVRVNGPEIFAGAAEAVMSMEGDSCFWEFDFELQQSGTYEVDVKLLLWNGDAAILENQCESSLPGLPSNETMEELKHDGFQGFKMYSASTMCCEICSRTPFCVSWSSPFLRMENPTPIRNGCELYFEPGTSDDYVPVSHLWPRRRQRRLNPAPQVHGKPHSNPYAYFLGCGWSFWFTLDFPCLSGDLDDRVFSLESTFEAIDEAPEEQEVRTLAADPSSLPLCTLEHEQVGKSSQGRWVREPPSSNVQTCPPLKTVKALDKQFLITQFEDEQPECWRRENLSIIGGQCMEMNCQLIEQNSLWKSSLHKETDFVGSWHPYSCRYEEFSTKQLQECVTKRKIVSFQHKGTSVAEFMNNFVQYRLMNVTMYPNKADPEATSIVFDTLGLLHQNGPDGSFEQALATSAVAPDNEEHYWISALFLSSEREVHTHVKRMERYNNVLPKIIEQKNYKMINVFDLTAAFTYDAATQNDGMHFIGPPMKAIVTKLFHHVCSDILSTSNAANLSTEDGVGQ